MGCIQPFKSKKTPNHGPLSEINYRASVFPGDREIVRAIASSTGFFREDEIAVAVELVNHVLAQGEASGYYFLFADYGNETVGFAIYGNIPCTQGSFDLYWIIVHARFRNQGIGKALLNKVEQDVASRQGRQLFIETSSTSKYEPTRRLYLSAGYREAARLTDFYTPGDDKLIYVKKLS